MCDTLAIVGDGRSLFAKNSDRPHGEPQVVESYPRRAAGSRLRTQYLEIDDPGGHAVVGSRPTWLWGLEHGVNEFGLAVGNERVFTTDDPDSKPALIGMDLVRLALERARDADQAVSVITALLEEHGQGGSCAQDHDDPYYSSFLLVDPTGAWVLETTGRSWVAEPAIAGTAISNRLVVTDGFTRCSPDVIVGSDFSVRNSRLGPLVSDPRLATTTTAVALGAEADPRHLASVMRDHGSGSWGRPGDSTPPVPPPTDVGDSFENVSVCQHIAGVAVTAASMIADLPDGDGPIRLWSAVGSPCVSMYLPSVFPHVPALLGERATWEMVDTARQVVEADPGALGTRRMLIDEVESSLWEAADDLALGGDPESHREFAASADRQAREVLRVG